MGDPFKFTSDIEVAFTVEGVVERADAQAIAADVGLLVQKIVHGNAKVSISSLHELLEGSSVSIVLADALTVAPGFILGVALKVELFTIPNFSVSGVHGIGQTERLIRLVVEAVDA